MSGDSTLILTPTILTPTARLARAEKLRLAAEQQAAGQSAWIPADVLAFSSWISRLRDEWFLGGDDERVPITATQALVLWQEVIDRDIFIGEPRVAEMAAASWRLIHEFGLDDPTDWPALLMSEDNRRFRDWAIRFRELCAERGLVDEWTFAASLPALIRERHLPLPNSIRLQGFDLPMTPIQSAIVEAAETAGSQVLRDAPESPADVSFEISAHADADDEMQAAARWARSELENNPDQRIAIVVPNLRERLDRVDGLFRQVFDAPGFALSPEGREAWHISLGPALSTWPLVADALAILKLNPARISQPEAASLLRSPFLAGSVEETAQRAQTRISLAERKPYWVHAGELAWLAGKNEARELGQRLAQWEAIRKEHRDATTPSAWVARFQKELKALGFGHGRGLGSREYQVLQRFHDLLEDFSTLDLVIDRPLSRGQAVRRLNERAGAASFREHNPGTPVEILGVEEALGSRFDALWITALDNRTWPKPTRRDPLIPGPVQAELPGANAAASVERARFELEGLKRTASNLRGSFATGRGEEMIALTPLLAGHTVDMPQIEQALESAPMEILPDDIRAPALTAGTMQGGTGVLQRQSDCPFRAFAEWRLNAGDPTPPRPGLDARARGSLVHKALEHVWRGLDGLDALKALDDKTLDARIGHACEQALEHFGRYNPLALSRAGTELERQCLERSLRRWLALEVEREDFTIQALEHKAGLRFGDLTLTGKIDRIDEIAGGGSVVMDYKTGMSGKNGWMPDQRLADVQLPAYALALEPQPVAITFARLRPDAMGFDGLSEVDVGTPGVEVIGEIKRSKFKEFESWQVLLDHWQHSLEGLAAEFSAGHAEVEPREPRVCDYCHLHSLCRIHERQWTDIEREDI